VGVLVTVLAAVGHVWAETAKRAGAVWKTAVRIAQAQRERLQTAAEVAAAEVAALQRQVQNLTAAGQLAGLVTDRVAGANYRSRLGVMTQIREDFAHMARLLADAAHDPGPAAAADDDRPEPGVGTAGAERGGRARRGGRSTAPADAAGDTLPRIDRIILYIDDLDRCPPSRVVEMLEAIHLLLAVDLFVVVVAVDPRWLLRAIAAHYRDLLHSDPAPADPTPADPDPDADADADADAAAVDPDDEELWRSTPSQYLEKIFQVVLTLPPLDTLGYQRLVRTLVGTRADQPTPAPADPTSPGTPATTTTSDARSSGANQDDGEADSEQGMFGVELPAARVIERVDPLTLEPDELTLLDLLGPPLLVSTPRAAKRLANSYGLLTAIRRDHRDTDLAEQHATISDATTGEAPELTYRPYRAAMVLLASLVAFPALGPALFLHLHHHATTIHPPQTTWTPFLETLPPRRDEKQGGWSNPADPRMTPVRAQQWQALLRGLHHIAQTATERDLPLPEPLTAWAD